MAKTQCPSCNAHTLQVEPTGQTKFVVHTASLAGMMPKTGATQYDVYLLSCQSCLFQVEGHINATHFIPFAQPSPAAEAS